MKYLSTVAAYAFGAAVVVAATYLAMRTSWPRPWAPVPLVTFLLVFKAEPVIAYGYGGFLFLLWSIHVALGRGEIPKRSRILFYVLLTLSLLYYITAWRYGLQFEGVIYTVAVTVINLAIVTTLYLLLRSARGSTRTFATGYAYHVLLFAWLVTYWCPYLGELA